MDKRTILAFALIGIIIFMMPYYFRLVGDAPPSESLPVDDRVVEDSASERSRDAQSIPLQQEQLLLPQGSPDPGARDSVRMGGPTFEARTVSVDTDLYTAVFSTRGGELVSMHLKDYHDQLGYDLELMGERARGLGVSIAGESLAGLEFKADRETLSLRGDEQGTITLTGTDGVRTVQKRLLFQGNRYRAELEIRVTGIPTATRVGLHWDGALADTEGDGGASSGLYAAATDFIVTFAGGEVEDWTVDRLVEDDPRPSGRITWVAVRNKYFLAALIPAQNELHDLNLSGQSEPTIDLDATVIGQYAGEPMRFGVYVGPLHYGALKRQNTSLYGREEPTELTELVQFGWNFVRPILRPVTILIITAFTALNSVIPNWGLVIMVFSILVKVVLFPLTRKSMEATARMQDLQPQIAALREKHASDQQKLNTEMMKLYKEEKVNPVGGCLPMLLQAPILFSLFNVFRNAIQLRQAGFMFWITDLSKPDSLAIAGFDLHVLPLLMSAAMFVQQKMTMKDPKQAAMVYIMPVFMIWIFWSMSSGLVLYFTMYNLLSLFEQQVIRKAKAAAA